MYNYNVIGLHTMYDVHTHTHTHTHTGDQDNYGWKIISTDVFRFPPYKALISSVLGTNTINYCIVFRYHYLSIYIHVHLHVSTYLCIHIHVPHVNHIHVHVPLLICSYTRTCM